MHDFGQQRMLQKISGTFLSCTKRFCQSQVKTDVLHLNRPSFLKGYFKKTEILLQCKSGSAGTNETQQVRLKSPGSYLYIQISSLKNLRSVHLSMFWLHSSGDYHIKFQMTSGAEMLQNSSCKPAHGLVQLLNREGLHRSLDLWSFFGTLPNLNELLISISGQKQRV